MILNTPRPCVNGCGAVVEWAFDRRRRVGLIESSSREAHVCPKRLTGAFVECACRATVHLYADGSVEDAHTRTPHACKPGRTTGAPAAPLREGQRSASPPPAAAATPPAPEPPPTPRQTLAEQLGL